MRARPAAEDLIARYLDRIVAHDWEEVGQCLSEDVVRTGPFGDTYSGKRAYVEFVSALMPSLEGYSMRVDRIVAAAAGAVAIAELTETVSVGGSPVETPEALVFDLDDDGLIARISIYIQRLGRGG